MKWWFQCCFDLHPIMTNGVEYLFMNLLAICISLEKYLFKSFAHFKMELFLFLSHFIYFCFLKLQKSIVQNSDGKGKVPSVEVLKP